MLGKCSHLNFSLRFSFSSKARVVENPGMWVTSVTLSKGGWNNNSIYSPEYTQRVKVTKQIKHAPFLRNIIISWAGNVVKHKKGRKGQVRDFALYLSGFGFHFLIFLYLGLPILLDESTGRVVSAYCNAECRFLRLDLALSIRKTFRKKALDVLPFGFEVVYGNISDKNIAAVSLG